MIDYKIIMNKTNGEIGIATPLVPVMREKIEAVPNLEFGWTISAYSSNPIIHPFMYLIDDGGEMLTSITVKTLRKHFEVIGDL